MNPTACSADPPETRARAPAARVCLCETPEQAELAWLHTFLAIAVWNCLAAVSKRHLDLGLDVGFTSAALRFRHPSDGKEVCWLG